MTNIPKNTASVEMKNNGMEVRREVVSIAIVMQLRRMVPIIIPLKRGVCRRTFMQVVVQQKSCLLPTLTTRHTYLLNSASFLSLGS